MLHLFFSSLSALPSLGVPSASMQEANRSKILTLPGAEPVKSTNDSFMNPASQDSYDPWIFAYAFSMMDNQNSFGSLFLFKFLFRWVADMVTG